MVCVFFKKLRFGKIGNLLCDKTTFRSGWASLGELLPPHWEQKLLQLLSSECVYMVLKSWTFQACFKTNSSPNPPLLHHFPALPRPWAAQCSSMCSGIALTDRTPSVREFHWLYESMPHSRTPRNFVEPTLFAKNHIQIRGEHMFGQDSIFYMITFLYTLCLFFFF